MNKLSALGSRLSGSWRGRYLFSMGLAAAALLAASSPLDPVKRIVLMVVGFGSVIFFHELGHFAVAKWCGVRCDVFSLGIGPRMLGWQKGVGFTFGAGTKVVEESEEKIETQGDLPVGVKFKEKVGGIRPKNVGETDYRLSWLPIGGFVAMAGQNDMDPTQVSNDPRSFNRKTILQRMAIVSAGVVMNLIFAAVVFAIIFSPHVGVDFPPAVVGAVEYGSPADQAGMRMGDRITAINGKAPREGFLEFTDLQISAALGYKGQPVDLSYTRGNDPTVRHASVTPVVDKDSGMQMFGIQPMFSTTLVNFNEEQLKQYLELTPQFAGLKVHDRVVAMAVAGGPRTPVTDFPDLYGVLQGCRGRDVTFYMQAPGESSPRAITVRPALVPPPGVETFPGIAGMTPRAAVVNITPPSEAPDLELKRDDVISRIGTLMDPSAQKVLDEVRTHPGMKLPAEVLRDGKATPITITPVAGDDKVGRLQISAFRYDTAPLVAGVEPDGPAAKAGVPVGATVTRVHGVDVKSWPDIVAELKDATATESTAGTQPAATDVPISYTLPGSSDSHDAVLHLSADDLHRLRGFHYLTGFRPENLMLTQKADSYAGAVDMGVEHTYRFVVQTYQTLRGLIFRTIEPSNFHGIIFIAKAGYDVQQDRGFSFLLYFLGLISVNLAVINFLPLPIVDGGLFLMLVLEKIRGRPLPLKAQEYVQRFGLALLGTVFLLVTFNDIKAMIHG